MPAVRLAELERETAAWAVYWGDPEALAEAVTALLTRYANPRYRAGHGVAVAQTPAYFVPPMVLEGAWRALRRLAEAAPEAAWDHAAALWRRGALEPRVLAARLLAVGVPQAEAALQRLEAWLGEATALDTRQALLEHAAVALARRYPAAYAAHFTARLQAETASQRRAAWEALAVLVAHSPFDNTPRLFGPLTQALAGLDPEHRPEALGLLQAVARRWPWETGPLMRRVLAHQPTPAGLWVLQRVLPLLPPVSRRRVEQVWPQAGVSASASSETR